MRELNHREHRLTLTALRDSALPTAGGRFPLGLLPTLLTTLAPQWWEYSGAAYGKVSYEAAMYESHANSALIDNPDTFTRSAVYATEHLARAYATDPVRTEQYGPGHEAHLEHTVALEVERTYDERLYRLTDGSLISLEADTLIARLTIGEGPQVIRPDNWRFGPTGRRTSEHSLTTFHYADCVIAASDAFTRAAREAAQ
ncbi:hypothetical protein ACFU0X_19830 [Streptomyces cellulosae]|uniref:DUF5753 domain-containing protein n=1 Tax=Streptomyces cellulosae TaxID=1968 RepID=A0ABW6JMB6_STRCE